jgi:histidine triad (HIT) family protein
MVGKKHFRGKEKSMEDCVFCKIVAGDLPCVKIYEDERVLAFADINPIAQGHTLLIPKTHAENIWEISAEDISAVARAARKVAAAIRKALDPIGVAALQLNGRGVDQLVMHYHLHLVPRAADGPPLPVTSWTMTPGDMAAIAKTAERIAAALD